MKKGLKALSAVLALSMGLISAGLVSANDDYVEPTKKLTVNDLSEGAQDYLKVKEKTEAAVNKFYESVLVDLDGDLAEAEEAVEALAKDAEARAKLNTLACNAAQAVQAIDNELRGMNRLMELAKGYVADTKTALNAKGETATELAAELAKLDKKATFGGDFAKLKDLFTKYAKAEDAKATDPGYFVDGKAAKTKAEVRAALKAKIVELVEKIETKDYQDAATRVSFYTEDKVNARVFKLKAEKVKLTGVAKIAARVAAENGIKIEACALPADLLIDDKAASTTETKKDAVPNTAAATTAAASTVAMLFAAAAAAVVAKKKASEM